MGEGGPEIRELQRSVQLKYAIFSTACSIVYKYCTRPISNHLFKDPLDTKHKIFNKKKTVFINVVSCLKLEYFFKVVKLNPSMGIIFNKWP